MTWLVTLVCQRPSLPLQLSRLSVRVYRTERPTSSAGSPHPRKEAGGAACSEAGVEPDTLARHRWPNDGAHPRCRPRLHHRLGPLVQERGGRGGRGSRRRVGGVDESGTDGVLSVGRASKTAETKARRHRRCSGGRRAVALPPPAIRVKDLFSLLAYVRLIRMLSCAAARSIGLGDGRRRGVA
jgi:hypothetical protein